MQRIAIDARMVGPVPHGFSRYVTRMAEGLAMLQRKSPLPYELVFLVGARTREIPNSPFGIFETVQVGAPFLSPFELLEIPVVLRKLGVSLYHSPTFSSLFSAPLRAPWACPCPWIVTVHDLNHLSYGGGKEKFYYERLLRPFARKSRALLTVSEFSRREIAAWLRRDEESIDIVYNSMDREYLHPLSDEEVASTLERFGLTRGRYFVCLANAKPHKNIPMLVEAYRTYRKSVAEALPLVLSMNEFEGAAGLPGVLPIGSVPDDQARALVAASRAVVFPSLYEGFGLPPVEAASMGVPVLVSRIPPHQEGLAELGPNEVRWLDPRDQAGWTEALRDATRMAPKPPSAESRMKLIARFDPLRMGRNMDRIYRRVLEKCAKS